MALWCNSRDCFYSDLCFLTKTSVTVSVNSVEILKNNKANEVEIIWRETKTQNITRKIEICSRPKDYCRKLTAYVSCKTLHWPHLNNSIKLTITTMNEDQAIVIVEVTSDNHFDSWSLWLIWPSATSCWTVSKNVISLSLSYNSRYRLRVITSKLPKTKYKFSKKDTQQFIE